MNIEIFLPQNPMYYENEKQGECKSCCRHHKRPDAVPMGIGFLVPRHPLRRHRRKIMMMQQEILTLGYQQGLLSFPHRIQSKRTGGFWNWLLETYTFMENSAVEDFINKGNYR